MLKIGSHVSIQGGLLNAAKEAYSYGSNTFMIYIGAPQNTRRSPLEKMKIAEGEEFDQIIGLDCLKVFHINGSLNPQGASKDRHANIGAKEDNPRGKDYIGKEALKYVVQHPVARNRSVILETPWLDPKINLYKEETAFLRGDL